MFTGIVEEVGAVHALEDQGDAVRVTVRAATVLEGTRLGDSISVNGVCLTVADRDEEGFSADVMRESLSRSNLGSLRVGSPVNLERALAVGQRLGGHVVQGHVDATAALLHRRRSEHWDVLRFALPDSLSRYVVEKGSITLNGTSLTVSALGPDWFEVSLIPTTLAETTHGRLEEGDAVNVEVDVLAKYVERLVAPTSGSAAR
ncbi:riboflavin synthase [Corynebacterium mastitidis]|uniref:Riboflavin synthase n=1 Tax=Corynebacterium mastitidis TaxID=161890 RepID=A0A2N0XAB3_9CORY|nr:riboflavin synthase [Corynebacterium mastitidis]MCH6196034.1 riboflavin synthase [Corynebacterium mastitidis]PKF69652.1 riboflavin synthase [Corynebacterium mastitidis]